VGATDRMWIVAPTTSAAYLTTNYGLYETVLHASVDRGLSWVPTGTHSSVLSPQTGPLAAHPSGDGRVFQVTEDWLSSHQRISVYSPLAAGLPAGGLATVHDTGTPTPHVSGLPSLAFTPNGALYVPTERPNGAGGWELAVTRSSAASNYAAWSTVTVPTGYNTVAFSWVAASGNGHVGVLFYGTSSTGNPGSLPGASWNVAWAESTNADAATPTWTVTTLETGVHSGSICAAASCMGSDRFAGDFISAASGANGVFHRAWVSDAGGVKIRYSHT
jgi:hypothetical protein